ncbi:hypothetical protein HYU22_05175 [Candidatus Woesearchaeota archaeon]|nr:hypothetical protein [Candidatus Woesearchaeota archaeon]
MVTGYEMERKYYIKDEAVFNELLNLVPRPLGTIADYVVKSFNSKGRDYRYFDTFEGVLEQKGLLAYIGPGPLEREGASVSFRAREYDYVFTVKTPTSNPENRDETELIHRTIPSEGTDFYKLQPHEFNHWDGMKRIRGTIGEDGLLQEVVRLEVLTNRFSLYTDSNFAIEIALDKVTGRGFGGLVKKFNELEIEVKDGGTEEDKEKVASYFTQKYGADILIKSQLPKWIKAMRLMRGEEIIADS